MNGIIRFSLRRRPVVVGLALLLLVWGGSSLTDLPIDVFPSLTRPRVVLMTEAPGLAPEEVETLITFPLETALNGASGVEAVRSVSGVGLSVLYVEFDWSADVYRARQVVAERIASVRDRLPEGVAPQLAPVASIMGQILMIGMWSEDGSTSPMETRTLADWVVRQRLLAVPGVSQVVVMGGERKQYQALVDPAKLVEANVSLAEVEQALREANLNAAGGYLDDGSTESLVRGIGRAESVDDLESAVVKATPGRAVLVRDVARVVEGAQLKRGDSSVNGRPAVVLAVGKQPDVDTRALTERIERALEEIRPSLPPDLVLDASVFQMRTFIELGVANVAEALRDGAILVVVVLFLFLFNFRTTFITLTAIPLSLVVAGLVFKLLGQSINVMTLGGLAVAMGELVDDAVVDVENVFRRLRQNALSPNPRNPLDVVYDASVEIRSAIVYGTMLVILVFLPLFALSGIEGRLFAPLGAAYIVAILASLLVSLTVTPALASYLLIGAKALLRERESPVLRGLKRLAAPVVRFSMSRWGLRAVLAAVGASVVGAAALAANLGADFLPPFDEGAAQVNVYLPPGASLEASNRVSRMVDERFLAHMRTPDRPDAPLRGFIRRSGRAELDEHAEGVHATEYVVALNPDSGLSRRESLALLRRELAEIPGVEYEVEQPLAHLISHMLSGVTAQIAVKIFGDDLDLLRAKAHEVKAAIQSVEGLAPPVVEPQEIAPQVRIELDREKLALYGASAAYATRFIETALQGKVVSTVLEGQRMFDLVVRLDEPYRTDVENLHRLSLDLPDGTRIPLGAVARVVEGGGPNVVHRENVRRRVVVRANAVDRDLAGVVADIENAVRERVELPQGYYVEYGGQFQAQQEASRRILLLGAASLVGVFLLIYSLFPSVRIVLQIMTALPIAFVGGVVALYLSGQSLTVASLVGFISLGGIAARNGILLVGHYIHLMREEGEGFTDAMVLRGSLERLAPVLMTALTAALALSPLVLGGSQPGKEILHPVATVIVGGLATSTLCEYLVHPGIFRRLSGADAERLAGKSGPPPLAD